MHYHGPNTYPAGFLGLYTALHAAARALLSGVGAGPSVNAEIRAFQVWRVCNPLHVICFLEKEEEGGREGEGERDGEPCNPSYTPFYTLLLPAISTLHEGNSFNEDCFIMLHC
jgi:hypothetical protein